MVVGMFLETIVFDVTPLETMGTCSKSLLPMRAENLGIR
jgi:hypothetical protein